jgi:CMP-N-acetylneuraminic acid synthetase
MHAWNQRSVAADGTVSFVFEAERSRARNKQGKPELYVFGNLIAARTEALLAGDGFYAKPCHALVIPPQFALDVDRPEDIATAEAMLASGLLCADPARDGPFARSSRLSVNER